MGSPSIPAQPAPPDYAAANKEGIHTDISTLPLRNRINQAAQLGQRIEYTDPVTGHAEVADFTGMGNAAASEQAAKIMADTNAAVQRQQLELRQELGVKNAAQTAAEIEAADPAAYAARQALTGKIQAGLREGDSQLATDTSAAGSAGKVRTLTDAFGAANAADNRLGSIYEQATRLNTSTGDGRATGLLDEATALTRANASGTAALSDLQRQSGATPGNAALADLYRRANANAAGADSLAELRSQTGASAAGAATYAELQREARANAAGADTLHGLSQQAAANAAAGNLSALWDRTNRNADRSTATIADIKSGARANDGTAALGSLADATRTNAYGASALNPALLGAIRDYELGGRLNEAELRDTTNNVRAGQVARGNYLGDAAAVAEAVAQNAQSDAKKQQRLQNLLTIQNQTFGQSTSDINRLAALEAQRFGQGDTGLARQQQLEAQQFGQLDTAAARQAALEAQRFGQGDAAQARQAALEAQRFGQVDTAQSRQAALEAARFGQIDSAAARQAALEAQRFGQVDTAQSRQAALEAARFGQSNAALTQQAAIEGQRFGQSAQSAASLQALAQQLFGNAQSMRGEERGAQAAQLGLLSQIAAQQFGQRQAGYQSQLGGMGAEADLNARQVGENRATRSENYGRDQQRLANASAMVLDQPITNQFGSLGAAQQGAVGFTPVQYNPVGQLNQNAGAQAANFQQGNFGTLANMWGKSADIAAQGNPWMSLAGNVAGAAAGAMIQPIKRRPSS